jgi:putative DNA primase/helicase
MSTARARSGQDPGPNGACGRPIDIVLDALRAAGCEPEAKAGGWLSRCPAHDDSKPSLSLKAGTDGTVLVQCRSHHCDFKAIAAAIGLKEGDFFPRTWKGTGKAGARARPEPEPAFETDEAFLEFLEGWTFVLPTGAECHQAARHDLVTAPYGSVGNRIVRWKDRKAIVVELPGCEESAGAAAAGLLARGMKEVYRWRVSAEEWAEFTPRLIRFEQPWLDNGDSVRRVLAAPPLPEIEITTQRHQVRDEAATMLVRDPRVFSRGGMLVMSIRPAEATAKLPGGVELRKAHGTPRVVPIDEPNMGCLLTENASLYKMVADKNGEPVARDVHPPDWLIRAIIARHSWAGARELLTVAECPYVAKDGSIAGKAGYDAATGTLLVPAFELPRIPDRPTRKDAEEAAGRLLLRFRQFPFASGYDFSVWLADLLTSIQRPAIRGPVPGFSYNGNKAGCGKGLLIDCRGILVWGGPIPTVGYPTDPHEADKVVLALALGGVQAVHFDNLEEGQFYGGSAIDSALTTTTRGGRVLGLSKMVEGVPLRPCWCLSGNNLSPGGDAFRRWIPCNLRTDLERPHERDDLETRDLKADVARDRPGIVADAILILRAYAAAGRPAHGLGGPLGSFEEWDEVVRGPVWFATNNDCLHGQREAAENSPRRLERLALLEAWSKLPGAAAGFTVPEVLEMAGRLGTPYEDLRDALMTFGMKGKFPDSGRLGYKLRGMKNANVGGLKLEDSGARRHHLVVWKVCKV